MKFKPLQSRCLFLLQFGIVIIATFLIYWRTDGFDLLKIAPAEAGSVQEPPSACEGVLSQEFVYLGKGRQCFAFESSDGKYVLKFFNRTRFEYPKCLLKVPLPAFGQKILKSKMAKKQLRKKFFFESFKLAFAEFKEDTGLLYVHLNKTSHLLYQIRLKTKNGIWHTIDLDQTAFVLQKKAEPILERLSSIRRELGTPGLQRALKAVLQVIHKRCLHQIADDDLDLAINFGFIEERPVIFDAGRFFKNPDLQNAAGIQREMLKSTKYFRRYLAIEDPELAQFFDRELYSLLQPQKEK